jgi:DNA-binding FadR family transcriptional regulator
VGLVASVEEQLERAIGSGMLHPSGQLPSEQKLARSHGVCRSTMREALRRLAARGLVVQHPGRKTRAVALDEAVTLENLGVALHGRDGTASLDRRQLLEGYFALKREATVELLVACREHASEMELDRLGLACFALGDAAHWEEPWVAQEFELLRMAARAARRPGHLLLIQSLERAWRGIQEKVLPHLDGQAVRQWAHCAMRGLDEADAVALKRELPLLLRACDERLLERLAPIREADDTSPSGAAAEHPVVETEPAGEALSDADVPNLSACPTGSDAMAPEVASQPVSAPTDTCRQRERSPGEAREPHPLMRGECVSASSLEGALPQVPPGSSPAHSVDTRGRREWRQGPPCPSQPADEGNPLAVVEAQPPQAGQQTLLRGSGRTSCWRVP